MTTNQEMVARAIGIARTQGEKCRPVRYVAIYALLLYGGDMTITEMTSAIGGDVRGMHRQNMARTMEAMQMAGLARVISQRPKKVGGNPANVWSVSIGPNAHISTSYAAVVQPCMKLLADVTGRNGNAAKALALQTLGRLKHRREAAAMSELGLSGVVVSKTRKAPSVPAPKKPYKGGPIKALSAGKLEQINIMRALCGMGAVELA